MEHDNIFQLKQPEEYSSDALTDLLKSGVKELISRQSMPNWKSY